MKKSTRGIVASAAALVIVGAGSVAYAKSAPLAPVPDANGVIHACYETNDSDPHPYFLRKAACGKKETQIDWNVQGVKGDKGDKGDTGDKGEKGDKGDKGDAGTNGTNATSHGYFSGHTGATIVNNTKTFAKVDNLPAGNYAVTVSAQVGNNDDDDPAYVLCELLVGGTVVDHSVIDSIAENDGDHETQSEESVSLQTVATSFAGGTISAQCTESGDSDEVVANGSLIAIKLDAIN